MTSNHCPTVNPATTPVNSLALVEENHRAFGVPIASVPNVSNGDLNRFRMKLIDEESGEVWQALRDCNLVEVFRELCDLQYVLDGAFLSFGLHKFKDAGMQELHRANMSKLGDDGKPIFRLDGKYMKGPNYTPPDMAAVLALPLADDPMQEKLGI